MSLFEVLPLITGEFETFARGRGSDLYRIREYTQEDPVRHVDWKATAKSGSLKVREFTREDERKLRIVFDNPEEGSVSSRAYENAVSLAASSRLALRQSEHRPLVRRPGRTARAKTFTSSWKTWRRFLRDPPHRCFLDCPSRTTTTSSSRPNPAPAFRRRSGPAPTSFLSATKIQIRRGRILNIPAQLTRNTSVTPSTQGWLPAGLKSS